jgi:PXPV repeat (3 copies)
MNRKHLAALALSLAGTLPAGLAQAHGSVDLQWSVTLGGPIGFYQPQPVYVQRAPVYVQTQPVYIAPQPVYVTAQPVYRPYVLYPAYRRAGWGDADRDGIPNRYDRHDNRRDDRYVRHGHGGHW